MAIRREKKSLKMRFASDWTKMIPGIALFAIFMFLGEFIDKRVYLTLCIVAGLISAAILILIFKVFKNVGEGFLFSTAGLLAVASFVGAIYRAFSYSFPDHEFLPFWYISLSIGIVIGIFFLIWIWGKAKVWQLILSFIIISALAFFVIEAYLCHESQELEGAVKEYHDTMERMRGMECQAKYAEAFVQQLWK